MRLIVLQLLCISQLISMACGAKLANIESSIDKDEKATSHIQSRNPKFLFGVSISIKQILHYKSWVLSMKEILAENF